MGQKYQRWEARSERHPESHSELAGIIMENRRFAPLSELSYGDHGLYAVVDTIERAVRAGKRIALYADYDVDGTMSCVSWIWFLRAIGYSNFIHYIPCRFKEGYGLNLEAIRHLIDNERAELIITMDTGITANAEAAYCRERGVEFVCTDHHVIQPERMPDCIILNPKMHPDNSYRELCGCGITFVLLRRLGERFTTDRQLWSDLLALTGMATICDVVPLNGVNHRLARLGVAALQRSERPVLRRLLAAALASTRGADEKDVGFRLGPRINAVGRLEHADLVVKAFVEEDPEPLIAFMDECNERRKLIQRQIVAEARQLAQRLPDAPALILGGDWHQGVVGIGASKIAEEFWRPVWLFQRLGDMCKGSARSIPGFDVTAAMLASGAPFLKCGGHAAAGGFSFKAKDEAEVVRALTEHAARIRLERPEIWESRIAYDCALSLDLASTSLMDALDALKPFGHGFEEPRFAIDGDIVSVDILPDKATGEPRHTIVRLRAGGTSPRGGEPRKLFFWNEVHRELVGAKRARFVVMAARDNWQGRQSVALTGLDFELS